MTIINTWNKCNCHDQLVTRQCSVHVHHSYHGWYYCKYHTGNCTNVSQKACQENEVAKTRWYQTVHTYNIPTTTTTLIVSAMLASTGIRLYIHMFTFLAPLPIPPQLPPLLYHLISTLNRYYVRHSVKDFLSFCQRFYWRQIEYCKRSEQLD